MRPLAHDLVVAVSQQATHSSADTTSTATARLSHYHHGWPRIVGGVIWLAAVFYVLWLSTRVVRAVERFVDKFQSRAP
jgi:hypothetical protein